ncbi:MAG: hypothetical protein HY273_07785 [Gammaproteobacteria bacterium]|nr:hypothetical protein [Gammaproteobacteria bacterium]
MTYRIPPSLKWLVKKRAYLGGELQRAQAAYPDLLLAQEKARDQHAATIQALEHDVQAVDRILTLHEIAVNAERIQPVQPHINARTTTYGGMTRCILKYLAGLNGKSAPTREVAICVALSSGVEVDSSRFVELRLNVRHQLKHLANQNRIRRIHNARESGEGQWAAL